MSEDDTVRPDARLTAQRRSGARRPEADAATAKESSRQATPRVEGVERKTLQVPGVMAMTGLGEHTVRDLIRQGRIKAIKAGRRIVVPLWAVEKFLQEGVQ